ncbi:hypothetical protein [Actinoallomurus rhizosphaericola]|uniref:hypothetical protein n=1 Tax=Actinoallomurus rhizosphaericola TaxID=2952536 RepID=UPI0020921038|nr:hypothetical protein [Actinoallomurus rhizosphaericola]MCO5996118.1 hypothetical protein [Actinoallomurus rhizosphaericola]
MGKKGLGKAGARAARTIIDKVVENPKAFREAEELGGDAAKAGARGAARTSGKRNIPHGFKDFEEFQDFGTRLNNGLREKYPDAQSAFQGSSVTGRGHDSGLPFDQGRTSDYDIAISGDSLAQAAERNGIEFRSGGRNTPPLDEREIEQLGLTDLVDDLKTRAGRPVNLMIYRNLEEAVAAKPSIRVWF